MNKKLNLIGSELCPYVQRVAIVLEEKALLVGDCNNQLVQYQLGSKGGWVVRRHYKDLGIGWILSTTSIGTLAVLGGKNGCIRVVDVEQAQTLGGPYKTAIGVISTLQVWKTSQVFLYVGGRFPDYSHDKTDLFTITEMIITKNLNHQNPSKTELLGLTKK